ncbi:hypothetical protein EGR_11238 [Echinococcus granulosus]|uniref:Uncharacterized protein n=1 Tax=Echinococcus granulosus TaxID=6210 RepID=W6TYP7_ECHGR|nr:hypothetical protein EGR_11238 [Echinococcus granulosus]EUB53905.1 hypothetical protein EGR_11238 [Echinococcus granulosus]
MRQILAQIFLAKFIITFILVFLAKQPVIALYGNNVFLLLAFIAHFIQWYMAIVLSFAITSSKLFTYSQCLPVINNFECSFTNF